MRAIPVTRAVSAGAAACLALAAVPSVALAERWLRPVPGEVARSFSYTRAFPFAPGAHRGVDLAASPGTAVRAACGGLVAHAGSVAGGPAVVSVRCGGRRVSYLPMASVAVRAGSSVRAGVPIGTVARGHDGLHVGVRREEDRFGYEDPAALLAAAPRAVPVGPPPPRRERRAPRANPPHSSPRGARRVPQPAEQPRPLPAPPPPPRPLPAPPAPTAAPWVAWAGLALVATGAAGSGTAITVRRRRSRRRAIARAASPA